MAKTQTEKKLDEELEKGQENFQEFLEVFGTLQEAIATHTEAMKALLTVITEDLIPAVDELSEETKTSRVIIAQLQGKKPKKQSLIDHAAQEIFGGAE